MQAKVSETLKKLQRRLNAMARFGLHRVRLSTIYITLAVVLAIAWGTSALVGTTKTSVAQPPAPATPERQTLESATPEEQKGGGLMQAETPGASNSQSSHTSVQSDDSGTTVTVNGKTESVPPNQSFQKSYDSGDSHNNTHVDVSVDGNTSESSGRSVNLNFHSSTESSSDDMSNP